MFLLNVRTFFLLIVNMYLLSLKINISSSTMVAKSFNSCITLCNYIITICISITSILTTQVLLESGDIQTYQGPKKSSAIRFCHWNLNGLAAQVPFNRGFHHCAQFRHCMSAETFLGPTLPDHDENININGYSLLRVDHPNNIKGTVMQII